MFMFNVKRNYIDIKQHKIERNHKIFFCLALIILAELDSLHSFHIDMLDF